MGTKKETQKKEPKGKTKAKKPKKQSGVLTGRAALKGDKTIYND